METQVSEKKKRGRKAKNILVEITGDNLSEKKDEDVIEKIPKKRGRKPKGGKFVSNTILETISNESKINIILHLKCKICDINKSNIIPNDNLNTYSFSDSNKLNDLNYMIINNLNKDDNKFTSREEEFNNNDSVKEIWNKLDKLSNFMRFDNNYHKKCSCFHCSYNFDNYPIYIPKYCINEMYYVYGCFCSPECAAAFLMNDKSIDNCTRFERYHLLNFLYCKIYNYNKNIKPAPNPYYTLEKYMGNLSIQEYRKLLTCERLLLVVDKPLIKSYPELFEESDDYLINCQGIQSESKNNLFKNKPTYQNKKEIFSENFNLK